MGRALRVVLGVFCAAFLVLVPGLALAGGAAAAGSGDEVDLTLFWGEGCPHCAAEKEWLAAVVEEYPRLTVHQYEVFHNAENRALLEETAAELGFTPSAVPVTVVGGRYWVGWSDAIRDEIVSAIREPAGAESADDQPATGTSSRVDVPLVGDVTVSSDSLVASTLLIGFVDGVNPCSLWVISVLLAIVVRTGSRRRVVAIGSVFLLVTAAMYALYMAGIYSAIGVVAHLGVVQLLVAAIAAVFGLVSVKDYFAYKVGVSFTIPDSSKPGLYRKMRATAGHRQLLPALAATVGLAVGVSLLETPCTAGFPVLWTGLLEANGVNTAEAALLFGLYMVPFLLDELIVFAIAVVTLRATKVQERHGRLLKLVGGTMMLALAATVLVDPTAMSDPLIALGVFGAAFGMASVVHLVTRSVRRDRPVGATRR
jgi:cytochrome c biogenesis protein CcdA/glutaredoxin